MKTESFGEQIKRHRLAAGMLIGGVAHAAEITPPYLGTIEAGFASPGLVLMGKLIRAVNCKIMLDPDTEMPADTERARKALQRVHHAKVKRERELKRATVTG